MAIVAAVLLVLYALPLTAAAVPAGCTMTGSELTSCTGFTGTHLDLSGDSIASIAADAFDGLTSVTFITLMNNQLTSLPAGVFDDLTSVTDMRLNINMLATLPAGVFDKLTSLTILSLTTNQLTSLTPGMFDALTNLATLYVNSNLLTTPAAGMFDALSGLTLLSMDNNQMAELPVGLFDVLTGLTQLYLSNNQFTTLPQGVFNKLANLDTLLLEGNELTALPAAVFDSLTTLATLRLQGNQFQQFAPFAFAALQSSCAVTIKPNPLQTQPCALGAGGWEDTRFGFGFCATFPPTCTRSGTTLVSCAGFSGASLALANFNLTTVGPGALAGLTLSGSLDLSRNGITSVAAGAFTGTTVAGSIVLSHNNLTEVPLTTFAEAVADVIDLRHNPLLRLPSPAMSPQYTDFVTTAIASPVDCKEPGFGLFAWKGSSFCTPCLPGSYCPADSVMPTACPVGTFNSLFGQRTLGACTTCAQGTYGDSTGAVSGTSCAYCPAGTWSSAVGATSIATCASCEPGGVASGLGNAACTACPAGTFQLQHGQAACTLCAAGTYGVATGATSNASCTPCPADRPYSAPGSVVASDCSGDAAEACAPGWHYSSASGGCIQCTPGYACPGGLAPRQLCPAGAYSDAPQAAECKLCTAGSHSREAGATAPSACVACSPGSVSASDGAADCTPCAAGTSQASPGEQTCTPCPGNTLCPAGSAVPLPLNLAPAGVSAAGSSSSARADGSVDAVVPLDGQEEAEVAGTTGSNDDHRPFGAVGVWAVPAALVVIAVSLVAAHTRIPGSAPQRLDLFAYSHKRADEDAVRQHPTRLGFAFSVVFLLAALVLAWTLWTAPNEVYTTALATKAEVARRSTATSTLQLRIVAYGVDAESECLGKVTATALGIGSSDGSAIASSPTAGNPALVLQHDESVQQCVITMTCTDCPLQPSATVSCSVPWHFQLLGWNVSAVSTRATSSVGGTVAPQAGGLLSGSAAFEVAWVPSFLVVEGDSGEGKVQESGHLLQFRSAQARQVAAAGAGVGSSLSLEFTFPISDVGHTTVVQTAQTVQQRAAGILAAVVSALSAARFVYVYCEVGVNTLGSRVSERKKSSTSSAPQRPRARRRSSVATGIAMSVTPGHDTTGGNDAGLEGGTSSEGATRAGSRGSSAGGDDTVWGVNPLVKQRAAK